MASKLNVDCLIEIFEILESDQATTLRPCILYPCILVNRQWCLSAIRILWRNPWHYRKNLECVAYTIINTYISTFSKESKDLLKENKIINDYHTTTNRPIFNYASFLTNLNLFHLEMTLKSWFHHNLSKEADLNDDDVTKSGGICLRKYKTLFEELLKHFLNQSSCIKNLNVSACHDSVSYLTNSIEQTSQSINCLAKLRYFRSNGDLSSMPKLYSLLSNTSPNLTKLQIDRYIITEELANLINAQKNLKEISFHKHPSLRHRPLSLSNNAIGESLINQSSSIRSLEIKGVYFQAHLFSHFENLRELNIKICGGMRYTREDLLPLTYVTLNHLQSLFWHSTHHIFLDLFPDFFKNNGKNLKNITIKGFMISDPKNSGILINSIANNCLNLRSFSGPILTDDIVELTNMLENCNELQSLSLHPSKRKCYGPQKKDFFNELMIVLINQPKNHLSELRLAYNWTFNVSYFELLMVKFEKMQKKKFKFFCDLNILRDQYFKSIVKKFVDLGVLKEINTDYFEFSY